MLHENTSPQTLGFARIWVFTLWFCEIARDPLHQLDQLPIEIFRPFGVLRLLPMPLYDYLCTAPALWMFKGLLLAGLTVLILGVGPYRPIAIILCILLTFYQGLIRGFGYINHSELAVLYAAYVLAVFPAADAFSLRRGKIVYAQPGLYAAPMLAVAFILGMTYAFVSVHRVVASAPEIFLDSSILRYVASYSAQSDWNIQKYGLLVLDKPWLVLLLQIGFPIVTLFEILSPLCLINRRLRWIWLSVMVPFHFLTGFLMGIFFLYNLLLIFVFFTNIGRLFAPRLPQGSQLRA